MANDMKYYLAIDVGASSGRHILGHVENGLMVLEEIFRFDNRQIHKNGHDCWDMENLYRGIIDGLKACKKTEKIPITIGIDTWGVDYVLLDSDDKELGDPIAYRDNRTIDMDRKVEQIISSSELYARTGIQKQSFNTIYQLMAHKLEQPEQIEMAESLLFMPDYLGFLLTGEKRQEYTEASTSGLLNAADKSWDMELIERLGLKKSLFKKLSMPGDVVGGLKLDIQKEVGFNALVVLPATHDTGSAFLAVPAKDENSVFISSGTWSLLGVENTAPISTEKSRAANFSNEGGAWYRFRYLKNIMGLWMIQSIRRELNGINYVAGRQIRTESETKWSFSQLEHAARQSAGFTSVVDVNDERFLSPLSMIEEVKAACLESNQPKPQSIGELMQCVYNSLAKCYADAINSLSALTNKNYSSINIVGGGCQDSYLNQLTAEATGLPVFAGPIEGTAIGNLIVQMIREGEFKDLQEARKSVRKSFSVKEAVL